MDNNILFVNEGQLNDLKSGKKVTVHTIGMGPASVDGSQFDSDVLSKIFSGDTAPAKVYLADGDEKTYTLKLGGMAESVDGIFK